MSNNDQVLFLHVPKTAGTAHATHFTNLLTKNAVFIAFVGDVEKKKNLELLTEALKSNGSQAAENIRLITGHNSDSLIRYLPNFQLSTVIRNPVEQLISAYNHIKHHNYDNVTIGKDEEKKRQIDIHVNKVTELEFLVTRGANIQTRFLCNTLGIKVEDECTTGHVDAILNRIPFIGLTEKLEAYNFLFCIKYNFPLAPIVPANARYQRLVEFIPRKTRDAIEDECQIDMYLHQQAEIKFDEEFIALLDSSFELQKAWDAHKSKCVELAFFPKEDVLLQKLSEYQVILDSAQERERVIHQQNQELAILRGKLSL